MKFDLDKIIPDKPIPARTINKFIAAVEVFSNLWAQSPLGGHSDSAGITLRDETPQPFDVQLIGVTSPYSWNEVYRSGTTWTSFSGARTGTNNAYEYNGASTLNNKITTITPVGDTWYKFIYPQSGSTPFCNIPFQFNNPCCYGYYCVTVRNSLGVVLTGWPKILFYGPGFAGIILQYFEVTFPASGTYTIEFVLLNGTVLSPPTGCSDVNTNPDIASIDETFSYTITCPPAIPIVTQLVNLTASFYALFVAGSVGGCFLTGPYGDESSDIIVTCTGPGTNTQTTFPSSSNGESYAFTIHCPPSDLPATYTITATCLGYITDTLTVTFPATNCGDPPVYSKPQLFLFLSEYPVYVAGCVDQDGFSPDPSTLPLPDVTATISGGGVSGSATTDATGSCLIAITGNYDGVGPLIMTLTHSRYTTEIYGNGILPFGIFDVPICGFSGEMDFPISGYTCACCPEAMPTTIHATIAGFSCTLTAASPPPDGRGLNYGGTYVGTFNATVSSFPVSYVSLTGPPAVSYYCVSNVPSSGAVCVHVTFDCGTINLGYYAVTPNGDITDPCIDTPSQAPCTLLPTNEPPPFPCPLMLCATSHTMTGTLECGPFMYTATSTVPWLTGTITISE